MDATPKQQTSATTCAYWVGKRARRCQQAPATGLQYCPSHLGAVAGRIPCPLDPKHTCYEHRLEQHLVKCPTAKRKVAIEGAPYFSRNINLPASSPGTDTPSPMGNTHQGAGTTSEGKEQEPEQEQPQLKKRKRKRKQPPSIFASMPGNEVEALVAIVRAAHARHCHEPLETVMLNHPACETYSTPATGACSVKHMTQQSSILAHMAATGLLIDGACFIEFGAGKGNLSDFLHACCPRSSHILVDRQAVRHKAERKFVWGEGTGDVFTRLSVDIAHLNLGAVPQLKHHSSLVSVAKHICGSASDLTIRCSINTLGAHRDKLVGMAVALCCHHRCTYDAYLNKEFLASVGISEKEYQVICRMSSWAVCCFPEEKDATAAEAAEEAGGDGKSPVRSPLQLSRAEKEAVGTQCKELLDHGRALYLRNQGFQVRLVRYVAPDISPENTLLLAFRPSAP